MTTTTTTTTTSTTPTLFGRGTLRIQRHHHHRRRGGDSNHGNSNNNGAILICALYRPAVRNAFNDDMYLDLIDLLQGTATDDSIAALIVTGTGPYFSSGADLQSASFATDADAAGSKSNNRHRRETHLLPAGRFMHAVIDYPKILCAAVNGPAVGIGATFLLHCDLVWCCSEAGSLDGSLVGTEKGDNEKNVATGASFWVPFSRLALVPELGSSVTLVQHCGGSLSRANELLLLGEQLDARQMVTYGIASRCITMDNKIAQIDPFTQSSLAWHMADTLQQQLLDLPQGAATARYFVQLVRRRPERVSHLHDIVRRELACMDERFAAGHVAEAWQQLPIGKKKQKKKSVDAPKLGSKL